jgi:hypothetical protein
MGTHPWYEDRYAEIYKALKYKLKKLRESEHFTKNGKNTKKTTGEWNSLYKTFYMKKSQEISHNIIKARPLKQKMCNWLVEHWDYKVQLITNDEWNSHSFWISYSLNFKRQEVLYFSYSNSKKVYKIYKSKPGRGKGRELNFYREGTAIGKIKNMES